MKIIAVGMNYSEHNIELGNTLYKPEEPVIFMKADSSLLQTGKPMFLPDDMGQIDYETELVVRICRLGKSIAPRFAYRYYDAVTVGIDFTAREMQRRCRKQGLPWDICKGFDGATAIGKWVLLGDEAERKGKRLDNLHFHLEINGETVQTGCTSDMLYKVDELIAYVSRFMTLKMGDILFTGTPKGVGPVRQRDKLAAYLENDKLLEFKVK